MAAKSPIENLTAAQQVQFFYVTFYGRPADPAGLAFWTDAVSKNGIINVVKDFGNSVESAALYGSLTTRDKIAKMYLTTFGRESDPGGLDYWTGLVTNKVIPNFAEAVVHMYNWMAPVDQTAVGNRQTVADSFTKLIDSSPLLKAAFTDPATSGKAGQTLATWMASVSADPSTVTAAQANTNAVITNIALGNANKAAPVFATVVLPTITEDGGSVSGKAAATDADNIPTVTQKLAYELVGSASSKGNAVTINASTGDFIYTPAANFNGADSFTVAVSDGAGGRTVKVVELSVVAVNDAPVISNKAVVGTLAATEDTKATGTVVASDVDVGDKLTYSVVTGQGPSLGKVEFADSTSGAFSYTPNPNANGSDSFVLRVSDGAGAADTVKVEVTIAAVNDAPKIADSVASSLSTNEDVTKAGFITATDVEGDAITYGVGAQGKIGTVSIDASTGVYTYAPTADKNGTDSFVLTASDGKGGADSITVNVSVAAVNDAPKIAADSVSTALATTEDTAKTGSIKATDADGDAITYAVASQGKLGAVSIDASTGAYTYTPKANENGSESFVLTASDGKGGADSITVAVTIAAVNDAPAAADDTATVVGGNSVAVSVLANDKDVDNDKLTIVSAVSTRGNVTINSDGTLTYKAMDGDGSPTGIPDSVIYTVSDGKGGTASATLTVNVVTRTGGSSGNDVLGGGTGNDIINALEGDDFVNGGGGLDRITAGDGNDTVVFSDEANFIRGGNDTDTLKLPVSGDFKFDLGNITNQYTGSTLNGTANSGKVVVAEFEIIDGSAAQSGITATAASAGSTVYGSSMADSFVGGAGNDYFDGGRGNDTLIGNGGVDTLYGGSGADSILGAGFLYGDSGADSITTNGAATVAGGADNDVIVVGNSGSIDGGDGNDTISTSVGLTSLIIRGGDGADSIYSPSGADTISVYGGLGSDTIRVDGLADYVSGDEGDDYIVLSTTQFGSTVTVHGGAGRDTLEISGDSAISGTDFKNISGFESVLFSYTEVSSATIGGASYTLNGNSVSAGLADLTSITIGGSDSIGDSITLRNIAQQVTINVREAYDAAVTSIDADSTTGSVIVVADSLGLTDVLNLAGADDYFKDTVGAGARYIFGTGSGVEFVELTGDSVNVQAAVSIVSGQSVTLTSAGSADSVSLSVALTNGGTGNADTVTVSGGSRNDVIDLTGVEKATVYGGSGNDSIVYSASASDSVVVFGGAGADTIKAGAWDTVYGDDLLGGSGDDLIILSSSADSTTYVDGGAGTDIVRLADSTTSSASLNRLVSIEGLDFTAVDMAMTLTGGGVSSTFTTIYVDGDSLTFAGNYGDTAAINITLTNGAAAGDTAVRIIADSLSDLRIQADKGIDSTDTINAGAETSPTATLDIISASIAKGDTLVTFDLSNVDNIDKLDIKRASGATSVASAVVSYADSIEVTLTSITADSLSLNLTADLGGMVTVTGGAGNDLIDFSSARKGGRYIEDGSVSSADTVKAAQSGDTVSDYISTGAGADSVLIDAGDTVYAGAGNDTIISTFSQGGAAGADSLDALRVYADTGSDWISIDGAYDLVDAGGDNDRIILTGRSGFATATIDGGAGSADTVSFADTVTLADSSFSYFSNVEVLDLASNGYADVVTLGSAADAAGIVTVLLGEADTITLQGMGQTTVKLGALGSGSFKVTADSATQVTLFADTGSAIDGGDLIQLSTVGGSDVISIRGAADSTYAFSSSDYGVDSIVVNSAVARVVTFTGIGSDSLGGLALSVDSSDTVTALRVGVSGADSHTFIVVGSSRGDSVYATSGSLSVQGGDGADTVISTSIRGNDFIDLSGGKTSADSNYISAGSGNDTLIGGFGSDTIFSGVGVESINSGPGNDFVFVDGSLASDSVSRDVIYLGDGSDSLFVTVGGGVGVTVYLGTGSDSVSLSDRSDFVYADAGDTDADLVIAGSGADVINLTTNLAVSGRNTVDLGADSDQFIGGLSSDSVSGGAGSDTISTGGGYDIVYGGDGDDLILVGLSGATGDSNFASGDAGSDTLVGGDLNDTLDGGADNDSILGGKGSDSISLGAGIDWVDAGEGSDIVLVGDLSADAMSRFDTISGGLGSDTLSITSNSAPLSGFAGSNLSNVSGFEVIGVNASSGTTTFTVSDGLFVDSALTLAFSGSASVSVVDLASSGSLTVTADTAVAALTLSGMPTVSEIVRVYASDSLNGDLNFTGGSTGDKVVLLGQTMTGQFQMTNVKVPTIELQGDTLSPLYNLYHSSTETSGSMTVSLTGGVAADTTDVVWTQRSADSVALSVYTLGGADSITTGTRADFISTGLGSDTVNSGSGADTILAGEGNNLVYSESGDDSITAGSGSDSVYAGAGNDFVILGNGVNRADLDAGRDTVYGGSGADSVYSSASDTLGDLVVLYSGSDSVWTGSGNDTIDVGGSGAGDSDYVNSGAGNDSIVTGDGNDTVDDGNGFDSIWTGSGNDSVVLGADSVGVDYIYLGTGSDFLNAIADSAGVYVSVDGGSGADTILTGFGNDTVYGSASADSISTGAGNDWIYAQGSGSQADSFGDTVVGGFGADYIDLGLSSVGDTDYLIFVAETMSSFVPFSAYADTQHSSQYGLDSIVNFDVDGNSAAESVSFDVFRFDFSNLADSVADNGTYISNGVLIGGAADYISDPNNAPNLGGAIAGIEGYLGSTLTQGEVLAFYWSGSWYVGVGAANAKIGSVVRFIGVADIDKIEPIPGGPYYKLFDDTAI